MAKSKNISVKKNFYAHGKLLLTGEYAVLYGAKAIGLPLKTGQKMMVRNARGSDLIWEALDDNGEVWFESQISLYDFSPVKTSSPEISEKLKNLLKSAARLNSEFLSTWSGYNVETQLEFPIDWGAGSSSTLIFMVAEWADVNPFHLHFAVSNGSGYDIACAAAEGPVMYQLYDDQITYNEFELNTSFTKNLYLVHLNKKQNSEKDLQQNGEKFKGQNEAIERISEISKLISTNRSFAKFSELIAEHEDIIAGILGKKPIQQEKFNGFNGTIKSLGAWGGDFILAASSEGPEYVEEYFKSNGYNTVLPFEDLVLL
jgi:mevalonate kinase